LDVSALSMRDVKAPQSYGLRCIFAAVGPDRAVVFVWVERGAFPWFHAGKTVLSTMKAVTKIVSAGRNFCIKAVSRGRRKRHI